MAKIVTMGEIMLRLSPEGNYRFVQADKFNIIPGGGEANVGISLANYGHESVFVSKLPKHEIGQIIMLRQVQACAHRKLSTTAPTHLLQKQSQKTSTSTRYLKELIGSTGQESPLLSATHLQNA